MLKKAVVLLFIVFVILSCEQPTNETIKEITTINNIPIIWKGSLPEAPANPSVGWAYYNTSLKAAFIWDESKWEILAQDGVSIIWKGESSSSPSNPQLNWAYYNIIDGNSYIYSGSKWDLLAKAGRDGASGILLWIGTLADAPSDPMEGWAYYNSVDGISYVWNGFNWGILSKDGQNGINGVDGIGIVWRGVLASPPASPQVNWAYYNSSDSKSYIWDGYIWQIMAESGNSIITVPITWKGTLTAAPFDPQIGWMYYNSVLGKTYIWDGTSWEIMSQDGQPGQDGSCPEGFLITWQGGFANAPINPQKGWAYYDSSQKKSFIWDGSVWQILAQDGADGKDGEDGTGSGDGETEDKEINGDGINYIAVQIVGLMDRITSEFIVLTFDESISGLDISNIQLIADTGEATFNKVSGDNKSWRIDLSSVLRQGIVKVKITKNGIDSGQKPVPVYKKNVEDIITYIAVQDGGVIGTADSKQIVLTFDAPVLNLPKANVLITDGTGSVVVQDVIGSGKSWFVRFSSITTQGTVSLSLSNTGSMSAYNGLPFDTSVKIIEVYKNYAFGANNALSYAISEDGILTISGTGEIPDYYNSTNVPWYTLRKSIKSIQLGENVTRIGNYAFYETDAESVIGLGITEIGSYVFAYCGSLVSIDLPIVTTIGSSAFIGCSSLKSVDFPLATTIGGLIFYSCSSLESVNIPLATTIDGYAFAYCSNLTLTITMGSAAPTLGAIIFSGINSAKTVIVKIPSGATGYSPASSPFNGTTVTVSGSNTTENWGNGLRGGAWTGTTWPSFGGTGSINQNITLIIQEE